MVTLAEKLGLAPGLVVALLQPPPGAQSYLQAATAMPVDWRSEAGSGRVDLLFVWPTAQEGLAEQFAEWQGTIAPDGAIWAVIPKKKFLKRRGVDLTWEQLQAAGLTTDLVDNKIASFDDETYATRFVIRRARRAKYQKDSQ